LARSPLEAQAPIEFGSWPEVEPLPASLENVYVTLTGRAIREES